MQIPLATRLRYLAARLLRPFARPHRAGAALFGAERRDALGTPYRPYRVFSADGLALAGRDYATAAPALPPVFCVPGLSRNSRDFEPVAQHFVDRGTRVVTLDLRGRGLSEWDDIAANYNPLTEANDVLVALDALGLDKPLFIGTSRGGLIAMLIASLRPSPFSGVVLNDIGPAIEIDGLVKIKSYLGKTEAPRDWAAAADWVAGLTATTFPRLDRRAHERLARRLFRDVGGRPMPDYDPKLAQGMEMVTPLTPLPQLWPQFAAMAAMPVLVLRGTNSDILSLATVAHMSKTHPDVSVHEVDNEGHAPLLEDADTLAVLAEFHARLDPFSVSEKQ